MTAFKLLSKTGDWAAWEKLINLQQRTISKYDLTNGGRSLGHWNVRAVPRAKNVGILGVLKRLLVDRQKAGLVDQLGRILQEQIMIGFLMEIRLVERIGYGFWYVIW